MTKSKGLPSDPRDSGISVSRFKAKAEFLQKSLDALKDLHPFISVVVLPFQAAMQMEITQKENDNKVVALKTEMMKMIEVLLELRPDPHHGSLEARMKNTLNQTAQDIRNCSAMCDEYVKKTRICELLCGIRWDPVFAFYSDVFLKHRGDFSLAFAIYTAQGVENAQRALTEIETLIKKGENRAAMLDLFSRIKSPKEKELQEWISQNGGPEKVSENENLFKQLLDKMKDVSEARREDKKEPAELMGQVRLEMKEDIEESLHHEREHFDRKFEAVQESTTRILDELKRGPYTLIQNDDLRTIWNDMAWQGSVKALDFVVAVQDYFFQKYSEENRKMKDTLSTNVGTEVWEARSGEREVEERWVTQYITLARVRPILEAFDADASGWISIHETNVFSSSSPTNYNIVKWLVFWAEGFRILCGRYAKRIQNLRAHMVKISVNVQPTNHARVRQYMDNRYWDVIDFIVNNVLAEFDAHYHDEDEEDEDLISNFADHVESQEARLTEMLEVFHWEIDANNTLQLIAGTGRVEGYIFPLLFLVLKRHTKMIQLACKQPLDSRELRHAERSIDILAVALIRRIITLQSNLRIQNLNPANEFEVAYIGMVRTISAVCRINYAYPKISSRTPPCIGVPTTTVRPTIHFLRCRH
ncbi:hypothetical protein B0H16DRAFT_1329395 [Mycena metata]|uniref:EF-hand domain-containing protein n=1 Tax=Mycena metata TaxID=1033252 RepID=A0AAD7MUI2_9AGAR|nr:hypothetical protein B0H16DRAFT_1329395 [Mycena metata]